MSDNSRVPGGDPPPGSGAHPGAPSSPGGSNDSVMERLYDTLHRSPVRRRREGRVIGGVAAGLARQFDLDPVLVRVAFVVLGMLLGIGVSLYLLAWFLLPDESGTLALQRAVRERDTGSIVLGVFAGLSLLNAPGGDDGGGWWTLVSLLVVGGLVYFLVRRSRGQRRRVADASGDPGSQASQSVPDALHPTRPGIARSQNSPTRGADTSVFDPVTGRWVPAVQGARPPAPGTSQPAPGPSAGSPAAFAGGRADHDWLRPTAPASQAPAPGVTPQAVRAGIGTAPTVLVLLGAAILGVGAAWVVQAAALAANALVVGAAVTLAFLSAVVVLLGLRGRRARALAIAVLVLLPFAAGVATFERTTPDGVGFSIRLGPQ